MNYLDFTAEEANLIAIYKTESRAETVAAVAGAVPHMDEQMQSIAMCSVAKLTAMADSEFEATVFASGDDMDDIS
jgi:hypothetical protein